MIRQTVRQQLVLM